MKNRTLNCQLFFSKTNDFLGYYLPCQAARSIHTIETYRDGLTVFRRYITNVRKISIKKFLFTDCTSELMLDYLGYLNSQGCEASTCNNRLAALRAYLWYASDMDISLQSIALSASHVPFLKEPKKEKQIIQDEDMKALLAAPPDTQKGNRDRMIMILLYDTAIRIAELLELKISSLKLTSVPSIHIHGKGDKERSVSLTDATVSHLKKYLRQFHPEMLPDQPLFYALFWCNHDQPRIVSRFGNEGEYWKESAKMLAGMIHLMRGTPYIYQGEEIGMTNPHYTSIEQYADVESRNYYEILLNEGKTKEEALEILAARSRDNSRTPMQWTDERYCGFSDTKPWIPVSDNFEKINVKKQKQDRDSILEFYKKLIMLRKEKEVIARGNIEFMEVENAGVLAYTRCLDKQKLLVCCNFRDVESQMEFTQEWKSGRKILGNYEENHKNNYKVLTLRPYEIIVLEKGEE